MDRVSVLPNERIDIGDYEAGAGGRLVETDQIRQGRVFLLPSGRTQTTAFVANSANTGARVLGGFHFNTIAFTVDDTAVLNRGRAVMPYRNDEQVLGFGLLQGDEGVASVTLDFSGAAASSTQAVWIRAISTQATFQNRVFWNPGTATEFVDNVSSRRVAGWEAIFQEASVVSPGDEWVKVWHVTLNGASKIASIADKRVFYFEGDAGSSYAQEWGDGADDRNVDRATLGIQDHHMFVQAVRRQFKDVIGTDWWKVPKANLQALGGLKNRFVTVDQPGGPGGDGDYASVNAAVTALLAGDGGTILLREGTYDVLSAFGSLTKPINFLATEGPVILRNRLGTGSGLRVLAYAAGSDGSYLSGISITENVADGSDLAMSVAANMRVTLRDCSVVGDVSVNAAQLYAYHTAFTASANFAGGGDVVNVTGAGVRVELHKCVLSDNGHSGLVVTSVGNYASGARSQVTLYDCTVLQTAGDASSLVLGAGQVVDVLIDGVHWFVAPPTDTVDTMSLASGNVLIRGGTLKLKTGSAFRNAIINTTGMTAEGDALVIDDWGVDCADIAHTLESDTRAGFFFAGRSVHVTNMRLFNVLLPDSTVVTAERCFIQCDPSATGEIAFDGLTVHDLADSGANAQHISVLGQSSTLTGAGTLKVRNCQFHGDNHLGGTQSASRMIFIAGQMRGIFITDNYFSGGNWHTVIRCQQGGVDVARNQFFFQASTIKTAIRLIGVDALGSEGYGSCCENHVVYVAPAAPPACIEADEFRLFTCNGNTVQNVGGAVPASKSIFLHDITALTVFSNATEDGVLTAAIGTQKPVTLTDANI